MGLIIGVAVFGCAHEKKIDVSRNEMCADNHSKSELCGIALEKTKKRVDDFIRAVNSELAKDPQKVALRIIAISTRNCELRFEKGICNLSTSQEIKLGLFFGDRQICPISTLEIHCGRGSIDSESLDVDSIDCDSDSTLEKYENETLKSSLFDMSVDMKPRIRE